MLLNQRPIHPGVYIQNTYLLPRKISHKQLAEALGINQLRIDEVLCGDSSITPDMACRLARFFNTTASFWIALQMQVDLWDTLQLNGKEYERIRGIA